MLDTSGDRKLTNLITDLSGNASSVSLLNKKVATLDYCPKSFYEK